MADEGKLGLRIYAMVSTSVLVMTLLMLSFIVETQPHIAVTKWRKSMMPKVGSFAQDDLGAKK